MLVIMVEQAAKSKQDLHTESRVTCTDWAKCYSSLGFYSAANTRFKSLPVATNSQKTI